VGVEVGNEPGTKEGPPRQEAAGELQGDPVDERPSQKDEAGVSVGHEGEGRQEPLAKLAVGDPWTRRVQDPQGEVVDEDRSTPVELDVERAGVPQGEPGPQRPGLDLEGQEGGILELAEGPLVGVGDELQGLGLEDRDGPVVGPQLQGDFPDGQDEAVGNELVQEPRRP
jgi:hypothetical protein